MAASARVSEPRRDTEPVLAARARAYLVRVLIVCIWASYPALGKIALRDVPPFLVATIRCALASAFLVALLLRSTTTALTAHLFPPPHLASPVVWTIVVFPAVVGALAHVWWYRAVDVAGPSVAAIFINLQPVVGVLIAWSLLGEDIGGWQLGGGALVIAGVALTGTARTNR